MSRLVKLIRSDATGAIETIRTVVDGHDQLDRFICDVQFMRGWSIGLVERKTYVHHKNATWPWANILDRVD